MTVKALTWAGRAIAYAAAAAIDRAHAAESADARAAAEEQAALLTPVVKAYCSDIGVEVASLRVRVHGGMGYVEETGAAQHCRDDRIAPIYEGTNGIQAIDLVTRKVLKRGSAAAKGAIAAERRLAAGENAPTLRDAIAVTRYYADNVAVVAPAFERIVTRDGQPEAAWATDFAA